MLPVAAAARVPRAGVVDCRWHRGQDRYGNRGHAYDRSLLFPPSGELEVPRRMTARARPVRASGRARSPPAPARRRSGCETMNSLGTLRPRALARSSTCFGERMVSAMMSSRREAEAL